MIYAVITAGRVTNVVKWDGNTENWQPPEDSQAVAIPDGVAAGVGWAYENGEFVAPPVEVPEAVVPNSVTMRQARLALLAAGKLTAVNDAVRAIPGPEGDAARVEWEFAATVDRDSAIVAMLAGALKLKPADLDSLFTTAAGL